MELWLSDSFDGSAWLGLDEMSKASAGRVVAGPRRLAHRISLLLGIEGPAPHALRVAQLAGRVREKPGFWSATAEVAAVDVALRLLDVMDALVLGGWDGASGPARLTELAALRSGLAPGAGDVLARAGASHAVRGLPWSVAYVDEDHLPPVARPILEALCSRGLRIEPLPTLANFDTPVELWEPGSLLEGAERLAEWLSTRPGTVVVGHDAALDVALDRLGLPTLGTHVRSGASATVRAFLAHCVQQSAASALAVLSCNPSPIPDGLRSQLLAALHAWPSVTSTRWLHVMASARASTATHLVDDVLSTDRERVLEGLMRWARNEASPNAQAILAFCGELATLTEVAGPQLEPDQQLRLAELACEPTLPLFDPNAGFAAVSDAAALVGACSRLVVWRPIERGHSRWFWTEEEQAFLAEQNVRRWRRRDELARGLRQARDEVLLVSPRIDDEGREATCHPLVAALRDHQRRPLAPASRVTVQIRPTPGPREHWAFPRGLPRREAESPLSIGHLIGCSFRHAARYGLGLKPSETVLADGPLLYGRLAHEAFHRAHADAPDADTSTLGPRAIEWLDTVGRSLCPQLFAQSRQHEYDAVALAIRRAGELLTGVCEDLGLRIVATEERLLSRHILSNGVAGEPDVVLDGRPDVVLGPDPTVVLDFKWSLGRHRDLLTAGVAHQLALYGALVRESLPPSAPMPAVGYLALRQGLLVVDRDIGSPHVQVVHAPPLEASIEAVRMSSLHHLELLDQGRAAAPGTRPEPPVSELQHSQLVLAPPCGFCPYGVLCGRAFGRASDAREDE